METPKSVAMVDPPGPLSTLEKWEQHLDQMRALPDDTANKDALVESAERFVAMKRRQGILPVCADDALERALDLLNEAIDSAERS
jgi:hypothetical protein